ncbi:RING/FYVE/PHD zinc finger superfamily protein [Abeliophyllum distichum]|uniref:RING/FYVE/PHD zinc finger superfamily protein n=1 Tax=Abeliophyllum distichum TaxID=126358 RepID=A0ABD1URU5_9LAMI
MKSGSHRLPNSDPHDDWVDGSWTVDCVCGVNFDDGEEMVNCDECGVWVHTRCSRFVKSDKSFACDKCKSKSSASVRNESEETEVAQFLVELPTKTLRMDNPVSVSSRRPFRLWTDIPMEERVHVQGVPGGDPGLFSGAQMSSVFGPQLWKATGYVPKKFNFQYREFPWWDDDVNGEKEAEVHRKSGDQNGNQVDDGAGVLYSLSKEKENTSLHSCGGFNWCKKFW